MLYIGAVEGSSCWCAPKHVYRMSDRQASRKIEAERRMYGEQCLTPGYRPAQTPWYNDNSREQIRDETIRQGLIPNAAIIERSGVPTTSSKPRYALTKGFAALFDPLLTGDDLSNEILSWQEANLSSPTRARIELLRRSATPTQEGSLVTFPSGETRRMGAGLSSEISKAVIEQFAPRFLVRPAVLWLSESRAKVVARDEALARRIGLQIEVERNLPDLILVDLGADGTADFLLVFVEIVATDGAITQLRQEALQKIAIDAGFSAQNVAFLTAYHDRNRPEFKKTLPQLAWRSFAWFATEPNHIIMLHNGEFSPLKLTALLRM